MDELPQNFNHSAGDTPFSHMHVPRWTSLELSTLLFAVALVAFIYGGLGWFGWQQLRRLTAIENAIVVLQKNDEKMANWINGEIRKQNSAKAPEGPAAKTATPATQEKK